MRVVILCPGESLASLNSVPPNDLSIAVNRAALRFPVDVWAAMDYPMIRDHREKIQGNPALLTFVQTWRDIAAKVRPFPKVTHRGDVVEWVEDTFRTERIDDKPWWRLTFLTAIGYAACLGAAEIDIYGADMRGERDFDGEKAGLNRTDERWSWERRAFYMLCDAMKQRTTITRHPNVITR